MNRTLPAAAAAAFTTGPATEYHRRPERAIHKTERFTIRTEGTEGMAAAAIELAKSYFKGFTVLDGTGYYEGEWEASLSIIILNTPGVIIRLPFDSLAARSCEWYVHKLVRGINEANGQECCLIEKEQVTYQFA